VRVKGERKKIWEERWITPDNIECPDRITRHSEVALASFVEIADDLPVTGHRLSRTVRDTDAARSMVEVFAVARFCAMELITKKIARSLRKHRELILNYFRAQKLFSSGVVEGLNNKAKVTMRKSYGFRTYRVLELALYHSLGKLPEPESTHDFF
jgi:hypothetical protein